MNKKRVKKDLITGLGFCLPFFLLYTVFTIWPVIQGVYVSMHKWSLMGKLSYVGIDNYAKLLTDQKFTEALVNTVVFVLLSVPALVLMALVLALLANRPVKIKRGLRMIYYLPSVISVSVASFIAKYMFAPYTWVRQRSAALAGSPGSRPGDPVAEQHRICLGDADNDNCLVDGRF